MANYKVTRYPHGCFSWADANVTDQEAGKEFYAKVMGWEISDSPLGEGLFYTGFSVDGDSVAGMMQMPPEMQGIPSHWMCYINVDDVDAVVANVEALGGTVIAPAMDVMTEGRMAIIQDPTGAQVGLWQAGDHIGAQLVNTHGAMGWNELVTTDVDKALTFYGELLGWTFDKGDESGYVVIMNKERMNGGIMALDPSWGDMPPVWSTYFTVPNLVSALERVQEAGGSIVMPIQEMEPGKFAVISDVTGAVCTLFEGEKLDPWEE